MVNFNATHNGHDETPCTVPPGTTLWIAVHSENNADRLHVSELVRDIALRFEHGENAASYQDEQFGYRFSFSPNKD